MQRWPDNLRRGGGGERISMPSAQLSALRTGLRHGWKSLTQHHALSSREG